MTRLRAPVKKNVTIELRPFQRDAVDQIEREISHGRRRLLYVAPTGAGKTVVGAEIINRAVKRHHRVLVITHRREIITPGGDVFDYR
jgi:superfamily II DNA or RNA helicase